MIGSIMLDLIPIQIGSNNVPETLSENIMKDANYGENSPEILEHLYQMKIVMVFRFYSLKHLNDSSR